MARVFDQDGNPVRFKRGGRASLRGMDDFGALAWEWLNLDKVRAEYALQGREDEFHPTTFDDVLYRATEQARDAAREVAPHLISGFQFAKTALILGAIVYAAHLAVTAMKLRGRK